MRLCFLTQLGISCLLQVQLHSVLACFMLQDLVTQKALMPDLLRCDYPQTLIYAKLCCEKPAWNIKKALTSHSDGARSTRSA